MSYECLAKWNGSQIDQRTLPKKNWTHKTIFEHSGGFLRDLTKSRFCVKISYFACFDAFSTITCSREEFFSST